MLVNPKPYLVRARREGWAMGGFNIFNLESARAVIDAGEELAAPLFVQTSEGAVKHAGLENMVAIVRQLASDGRRSPRTSEFGCSVTFRENAPLLRLSAVCPLLPGDLIFTGTSAGVGAVRRPRTFLQPGQELTSWVEGFGQLRNRTVGAASRRTR